MPLSRELMGRPRLEMPLARRGVAGVSLLGRYNYSRARPALIEHQHANAIEICFLVKGRQTYHLGGRSYRLTGGDIFISYPGERHSTGGLPEEKGVLYWMILEALGPGREFLGLPGPQGRALRSALQNLGSRHFRGSWKMKEQLDSLVVLYHRRSTPLNAFRMANAVGAFLSEVLACGESARNHAASPSLLPVLEYIGKHLEDPLPVPQLAALAGISLARFKARFKEEIGVPPGEYVLRERVKEAQRRLQQGNDSVTRIAFDLGFSTSQYFATVYKRFTTRTPSSGRRAARPLIERVRR